MQVKRYPIERLEQAFRIWEDALFLNEMALVANTRGNLPVDRGTIFLNWKEFRRYLLETRPGEKFDVARFSVNENMFQLRDMAMRDSTREITMDSNAFFGWTVGSRKAFHVTENLSHLLANTSLGSLTWNEIGMPFDGFAVTLEKPLIGFLGHPGQERPAEFDCFVVYRDVSGRDWWWVSCYQRALSRWKPVTREEKTQFARLVQRKDWSQLAFRVVKRLSGLVNGGASDSLHYVIYRPDLPVVTAVDEELRMNREEWGSVGKREAGSHRFFELVGGLCMYLRCFPKSASSGRTSREHNSSVDTRAIVWETDVTTVASVYTLTPEERKWFEEHNAQMRHELGSHWRRGHWRRPMGMGHIVEAKRTVWVRPTLVRSDRLPEGAQPGGSKIILDVSSSGT